MKCHLPCLEIMNSTKKEVNSDPDYENIHEESVGEVNESLQREDARDQAVQKIQNIINEQFSFEIDLKGKEVSTLNRRVHECRTNLDRLRACILAGYYGYGTLPVPARQSGLRTGKSRSSFKETNLHDIMNWKRSLPSDLKEQAPDKNLSNPTLTDCHTETSSPSKSKQTDSQNLSATQKPDLLNVNESRFYVKRRIIVGNTSKYILPEQRDGNDRSTHKWMVYVRGPKEDSELQIFISKVWFLLHPSYQPNDLVEVSKPPFQVTRRGWGEFPVRVQLHFVENKNKRVDIIHHLKLDKTYTGLQTLGAETHVDIELDRKNFDGSNSCQSQDKSDENIIPSSKDITTNPPTESVNTMPVSSTSFDLAMGQQEVAMDCNNSKIDKKELKQNKHELKFKHGVLSDHSYSTVAAEKLPHEDDMKYPTPPTSTAGSKHSSPKKEASLPESEFEQELWLKYVKEFPLIKPGKALNNPGYCAGSLEQFLGWNLGKRLAAEWQRASAIKAHIEKERALKCQNEDKGMGVMETNASSLSTKEVMNYLRMHGYTPMVENLTEGSILCKFCGEEVDQSDLEESDQLLLTHEECISEFLEEESFTTAKEFLEMLNKSENISRKHDERGEDEEMIDVLGGSDELSTKDQYRPILSFLPVTTEHEWIQETARQVDVMLTNFDIDGVHAPVTTAMLYKACTMFVEDIIRKANRFTWKSTLQFPKAKCILPYHVRQALHVLPHCDFLTNNYLKVEIETQED